MPIDRLLQTLRRCRQRGECVFSLLWLFVIGVSVYDGYLVLSNRAVIMSTERNPVGRWLLSLGGGDVWLLLAAKAAGTIVAGALLLLLFWSHRPLGQIACAALATAQLLLLAWLQFARA
jgi:hypothetical protein